MDDQPKLKPVIWIGSSRKDIRMFPEPVQEHIGYALYVAQRGGKHQDAKTLKGFSGAGVVEVVTDFRGDTFRAVYTLRFADAVYVLPAFEKKSKTGPRRGRMSKQKVEVGSRNVFQDLGLPNAEEHLIKAQPVFKIDGILKDRGLTQVEARKLLGIRQPDVSKMLRGEFRQFSVERLLRFLVALNYDVDIVIKPHVNPDETPKLQVC